MRLIEVTTSARGLPVGESHKWVRWRDHVVAQARAQRAAGRTYAAISAALGVPYWTVAGWLQGRRRRPPDRVVIKRVEDHETTTHAPSRAVPEP